MKIFDVIKFKRPIDEEEKNLRFIIKEINGNRILCTDLESAFKIKPVFCYKTNEVQTCEC